MSENKMGYRGSKSEINSVKEQRVDGSWCYMAKNNSKLKPMRLRCTLLGSEMNYQFKIPSKQLYAYKGKNFSTFKNSNGKAKAMNP